MSENPTPRWPEDFNIAPENLRPPRPNSGDRPAPGNNLRPPVFGEPIRQPTNEPDKYSFQITCRNILTEFSTAITIDVKNHRTGEVRAVNVMVLGEEMAAAQSEAAMTEILMLKLRQAVHVMVDDLTSTPFRRWIADNLPRIAGRRTR